jgi:hypothetical protein
MALAGHELGRDTGCNYVTALSSQNDIIREVLIMQSTESSILSAS